VEPNRTIWSALLPGTTLAVSGISRDDEALYLVHDGEMLSFSLETGRRLWKRALVGPAGQWRTARLGDYLLAWPIERRSLSLPVPLTWGRLEWNMTWDEDTGAPLLLCDARNGKLVQRINVPAAPPKLAIQRQRSRTSDSAAEVALTARG